MQSDHRCARCAAPLTPVGGGVLCPACLLEAGLEPPAPDRPLSAGTVFGETESAPVATGVGEARMFGDYELLEEIARGGMGVVYRARQRSLDRLVAVKMLLFGPHASADLIRRFKTEAVAAGALHHPNIVAVHEVGLRDGRHYIVMDYVDGPNLAQLVKDRPPPARQAARYLRTIAEAVHHAHEHGVLHRDLKPSNVLMDARDQPRVTDFGLARRLDTDLSLTVSGQVLGSPNFMPPEQVTGAGAKVGRRSDVYGLGATLYHLLTGRPPFQGESLQATLHQVLTAEPVSPRLLNPGVPRDLETICLKCLDKEPARRYATAQELADELGRFLRDEPIQARPVSRPERVWRWARRKPVLALLLLLVHVVGAAGLAGIVWQWLRAEQNATEARTQRDTAEGRLYAAQLRLAHAEYRAGRLGSAQRRLEAWEPARRAPGRPDWRGFEWRWLQRLCAASPGEVIATNASGFTAVAASPDGTSLALGAHDGTIQLLDASTTTPGASWRAHPGAIDSVEFIPGQTHWLVTVGGDEGLLKVWDIREPPRLLVATNCSKGMLAHATVSRTGRFVATGTVGGMEVDVWELARDSASGQPRLVCRTRCDGQGPSAFSPDGRWVAMHTTGHRRVLLGPVHQPSDEHRVLELSADVRALGFSADSQALFAATADENIHACDLTSPDRPVVLRGHSDGVNDLTFLGPKPVLISVSSDRTARRWRTDAASLTRAAELPSECEVLRAGGDGEVGLDLSVAPDQRRLAVACYRQVWVFDLASGRVEAKVLSADAFGTSDPDTGTTAVAYSPSGVHLALGGLGNQVVLLDAATHRPIKPPLRVLRREVAKLAFALGGRVLVVSGTGEVALVDVEDWQVLRHIPAAGNVPGEALAVSANGQRLAMATTNHQVVVREIAVDRLVATCPQPVRFVGAVAFSPDAQSVAFSDESGAVYLWDLTGQRPLRRWTGHRGEVLNLAFSPDGRTLASGGFDFTIRLWHPDLDQDAAILTGHRSMIFGLAFGAHGDVLASVSLHGGAVLLWRAKPAANDLAVAR